MAPNLRLAYKVVGDCTIYADVYLPPKSSQEQTKCPVALAIHGGAFILGHSAMVSKDQIDDCLARGWIVIALEHRLCPQVDIFEGPMADCRDALDWVYSGAFDKALQANQDTSMFVVDHDRIVVFGTSSGGTLALALGFNVKRPVTAILNLYGATNFTDPFWSKPLPSMKAPDCSAEFINQVYDESPITIQGGVSLEGQAKGDKPPPIQPRTAFALTHIANGTLMDVCFPSKEWEKIDATLNVTKNFPPTAIMHGLDDVMVPIHLSKALFRALQDAGVESTMIEVPDEGHTFVGKMKKGTETWNLQRKGFDFLENVIDLKGRSV